MMPRHAFVVAAHGRSPYLEACLLSLASQTCSTPIFISTSTPFPGIEETAAKYGATLLIHETNRGIGNDWNAALSVTGAQLTTIAHQDDIYAPTFAEEACFAHAEQPDAAFYFCDSDELGPVGKRDSLTWNHHVKRMLLALAFSGTQQASSGWRLRMLLGFGNPIICASVTINRTVAPGFRFREDLRTNMDWFAWVVLTKLAPAHHIPKVLLSRRVHDGSETSHCILDGSRSAEDKMMFAMLWPWPLAWFIAQLYRLSYRGYSS